ncbi:MAG: hypothetical protein JNK37_12245 [Verrucomicrobiales bacterium]|nr:hypothetical protein [Verrucomicrobiales bacterium]
MKPSILFIFVATVSCVIESASAQGNLVRRLDQNQRALFGKHDFSSAIFSSDEERAEYFGGTYTGVWKFGFDSGAAFDTNVFKDAARLDDWHWDYSLGAAYEWWVSEASGVQITPAVGWHGSRFAKQDAADAHGLGAEVAISLLDKMPVDVALTYGAVWEFDGAFGKNVFAARDLSLNVGKSHELGKTGMEWEWSLGGGYLYTTPAEFESPHADATLALLIPIADQLDLAVSGGVVYSDFANAAPPGRDQWQTQIGAELTYALGPGKEAEGVEWGHGHAVKVGVLYTTVADSDPTADYSQWLASISLGLSWEKLGFAQLLK